VPLAFVLDLEDVHKVFAKKRGLEHFLLQRLRQEGDYRISPGRGTRYRLSPRTFCGAPSCRAATTANSAPALLAKYLAPVSRHLPPSRCATVSTAAPRSDPPLIMFQHAPVFGRVKDFIHPRAPLIEHA